MCHCLSALGQAVPPSQSHHWPVAASRALLLRGLRSSGTPAFPTLQSQGKRPSCYRHWASARRLGPRIWSAMLWGEAPAGLRRAARQAHCSGQHPPRSWGTFSPAPRLTAYIPHNSSGVLVELFPRYYPTRVIPHTFATPPGVGSNLPSCPPRFSG